MNETTNAISSRVTRLNSIILNSTETLQKTQKEIHEGLNREALLDSLFVLYHECNKDAIKKKSKNISDFVNKYRTIIKETKNLRVNLTDFEIKKLIGSGYFGDVHLVTERHTNDVYAMKKIKKSMVNSFQVKEERDIMVYGRKSDWLTTLQYSFQDSDHLYLIMEFLPGGDLLSLMIRNGAFDEPLAKFYLAEMTLALNALHRLGYVHRDIKPENILLDRFGHLKLADFGSSISLNEDGCFTNISPVGTPDYIAPELLQILSTKGTQIPQKLGTSCDFWSMGVIGYEMITEKTPFHSDNLFDTYNEIQNYSDDKRLVRPLEFPAHVRISRNFRDLLNSLITKPSLRLNYDEIIEHPFFHGINWHTLREQSPPIIPTLSGEDDTSNFEDVDKSLKRSPMLKKNTYTPIRVNEFSGEDLPFLGYTYVYEEVTKIAKSKTSEVAIENKLCGKIKDLQATIKEQMREIKELQKDLLQAERKAAQMISLDKMYHEAKREVDETKANLKEKISELAASKTEIKTLKSTLKIEEEMRIKNDATISDILSMTYQKWENAKKVSDQHFEKQIEEKKTEISNLLAKIQARDNELSVKIDDCDHLQATVEKYKEMLKNAKEQHQTDRSDHEDIRRQLASNFEVKIVELKTKLNSENEQKRKLADELKELKNQLETLTREKTGLVNTKERNEIIIKQLKDQLEFKCEDFKKLQEEKREAVEQHFDLMKKYDDLKEDMRTLKEEKKEVRLSKIQTMTLNISSRKSEEMEFRSAHGSLTDLDKVGLAEQQLRCDLERAKENENIQRKRAENLEEVVGRLEEIIKKFNQTTEQTAGGLLEKRNERLEDQLAEAREQAIIDRQSARTANLSLWKLEKELNDVKHEKTLLQRRLDTATEKTQKFDSEKQCFEMKSNQYLETISSKEKQIEELQKEIRNLKYEMKMDREKWNRSDRERLNEKTEIIEGKSKIKSLEEKLSENNRKMSIMEQKFNALLLENDNLHHELTEHQQQIASTQENASELENEHDILKKNYEMLKEACNITESQLNELEEMWNKEVQRNKLNGEKIDELLGHVRSRDEDILKLKKDLAQEKSLKMMAETKGCQLQNESDELKEEMQELQKEMCQMQQKLIEGTQKLYEAQECVEVTNSDLSHLQRLKANYESELSILKEENSRVLTDFYLTKEEVKALNMQLKDAQAEINELIQEKDYVNGLYAELKTHSRERDIKSEATLAQHKKLIEYLQERVEELTQKKKKTLADKIFGGGNTVSTPSTKGLTIRKENINPQDEAELKRVKGELKRERDRSQRLKEDLMRTKIEIRNTKTPTEQIETYNKSPGRNNVERNVLQKTSLCESTDVIEGTEQTIQATVHAEPDVKVQDKNEVRRQRESMEPAQHHFSLTIETASPGPNTPAIQCVVCSRIILQGSPYWQCKECKQMVHRKCRGNVKTACEIYGSSSASSTSSSTATTATLNGSSKNVKKFNLDDVDGIAELSDDNRSEASSDFIMNNYYGDTILSSSKFGLGWTFNNTSVTINAVYDLGENKILLGCSNGLYSYHVDRDEIVNIKGINSVNYFAIKPNLTKSIIIGDDGENLYECDLRMLSNKSQASSYLEPKLNFQQIDLSIANRCTNTEKWHIVEMHGTSDNLKDARAIAATDCRMVILKYDTKTGRFKPVRALDTAQSISGILFTQHTAILSCDKFFEIDLNTYVAEEFLDMSDQSLRTTKSFQPMNVFRINSLEFLLCFQECGVFVDEYGLRSRPDDLKWLNDPQQFFYKNYLLYIIHKESIQIMRINNTYTKHQEDQTTDNNQFRTFVSLTGDRRFTHDCIDQQYCVNVIKTNKIVDGDAEKMTQDLIKIDAEKAFKTHLNRSMSSIISSNSSTSLATLASGSISATSCDTIN